MSVSLSENSSSSLQLNGIPGLKFKITNDYGVESYLIGTWHVVDKPSINDPDINKIIDKCSVLYTEKGNYRFLDSSQGSLLEENHQYQHIPFRYSYDTALTIVAWCKKIPVMSLDYSFPGNAERWERTWRSFRDRGPDETERNFMDVYKKAGVDGYGSRDPGFRAWKKGDIFALQNTRKSTAQSFQSIEREKHWAKTLVPHLMSSTQPICIAVGVYHTVGNGLPEIFRKAGLKVERILPPSSPSVSIPQKCAMVVRKTVQEFLPTLRSRL